MGLSQQFICGVHSILSPFSKLDLMEDFYAISIDLSIYTFLDVIASQDLGYECRGWNRSGLGSLVKKISARAFNLCEILGWTRKQNLTSISIPPLQFVFYHICQLVNTTDLQFSENKLSLSLPSLGEGQKIGDSISMKDTSTILSYSLSSPVSFQNLLSCIKQE